MNRKHTGAHKLGGRVMGEGKLKGRWRKPADGGVRSDRVIKGLDYKQKSQFALRFWSENDRDARVRI